MRTLAGRRFGWLDAALVSEGVLRELAPEDLAVYAFLCLVGDRQGVSFYSLARLGLELGLDEQRAHRALARLRALDLVAFAPFFAHSPDGFHQVLAFPRGLDLEASPSALLSRLADLADPARVPRRPQP
ncbi:MAG: hypothetical protein AB7N76_32830 [Planctomycetota bacterium]